MECQRHPPPGSIRFETGDQDPVNIPSGQSSRDHCLNEDPVSTPTNFQVKKLPTTRLQSQRIRRLEGTVYLERCVSASHSHVLLFFKGRFTFRVQKHWNCFFTIRQSKGQKTIFTQWSGLGVSSPFLVCSRTYGPPSLEPSSRSSTDRVHVDTLPIRRYVPCVSIYSISGTGTSQKSSPTSSLPSPTIDVYLRNMILSIHHFNNIIR